MQGNGLIPVGAIWWVLSLLGVDKYLAQKEHVNFFNSVEDIWFLVISLEKDISLLFWREVTSILGTGLGDSAGQYQSCKDM